MQGKRPNGDRATTIFDLREDRFHVAVYPATLETFAVLINRAAVEMLHAAAESRSSCAVPASHALFGSRLLGLRPYDIPHEPLWAPPWADRPAGQAPYLGPMEICESLPGAEIRIIYARDRLLALRKAIAELAAAMTEGDAACAPTRQLGKPTRP